MRIKINISAIILSLFLFAQVSAQSLFEPVNSPVYELLSRLSQKGIIEFNDQIKPLERQYIFSKLSEAEKKQNLLTAADIEELNFRLLDYKLEKNIVEQNSREEKKIFKDESGRIRLFSYSGKNLKINVDPVFGYSYNKFDSDNFSVITTGLKFSGYISDNVGFSFSYRDNAAKRKLYNKKYDFSNKTGVIWHTEDFAEVNTHISYGWNWGSISAGKEFMNWGYGEGGKLVLSDKAPSFPFIRLDLNLTDWLSFNYFHAWLSSNQIDSSSVYPTSRTGEDRTLYREKYLASHTLTIRPVKGLDISLGESIVYSDRLEIAYLMPLMFFRLADHYLSKNRNNAGDNSQFFLGVSSKNHIKNTHLYGTVFIDEISIGDLFNAERERNQLGFTIGGSVADLPVENLKLTAEFTKIYPFVYRHYIPAQTYESSSYLLGHWMGHNSDQIYLSASYRILRGLNAKIWYQRIRKGGDGVVEMQYVRPSQPFLFGGVTTFNYFGLKADYEIIHTGYVFLEAVFTNTKYSESKKNIKDISFGLSYGL